MLRAYGHYKILILSVRGSSVDAKVDIVTTVSRPISCISYNLFKSSPSLSRGLNISLPRPTTSMEGGDENYSYLFNLTLSSLNLSFSSSSTTSRELLSQFSTCSG